ncbi:MAG TPA: hypothetical protein VLS25_01690, partial [Dehalococcoidia bacterium]|nr:hypothetical protein [Dehalococcoidia bacterium]
MRSSSVRLPFFAAAAIAGLVLAFASNGSPASPRPALATHDGGADAFLIDMDPAGNTSTSVGPVETCVRLNPNGVQDADEDGVDSIILDIVTGPQGIPAGNPMIAFNYVLAYPSGMQVTNANNHFLLSNNSGSMLLDAGDSVPDSDGLFYRQGVDLADWSVIPLEFGQGVLSRVTLSTNGSTPVGVGELRLSQAAHIGIAGDAVTPDNGGVVGAHLAVGTACPPPQDIVALSSAVSAAANAPVGARFSATAHASFSNTGTRGVNANVFIRLDVPPWCAVEGVRVREFSLYLPPSASVAVAPETFQVWCFRTGGSALTAAAAAGIAGTDAIEANPLNNSVVSSPSAVGFVAVPPADVDVEAASDRLYLASLDSIFGIRTDGSDPQTVFYRAESRPSDIQPDVLAGRIYWATGGSLRHVNFDGTGEEELFPTVP